MPSFLHERGAGGFKSRGHEVGDEAVLMSCLSFGLDAFGPGDDQGIGDAAIVHDLLGVFERRVAGHGPARVIMRVGIRAAPFVVVLHVFQAMFATR